MGVHKFSSTNALLGDMGWTTANSRHKILILKFWNRLIEMPDTRVTKNVFIWDISHSHRKGTWSHYVKGILNDIGCEDVSHNIVTVDIVFAKDCIIEHDRIQRDVKRYRSDKLRYYNMYEYD